MFLQLRDLASSTWFNRSAPVLYQRRSHPLSSEELRGCVVLFPKSFSRGDWCIFIRIGKYAFLFPHPEEKAGFEQDSCTANTLPWEQVVQRGCAVTG